MGLPEGESSDWERDDEAEVGEVEEREVIKGGEEA